MNAPSWQLELTRRAHRELKRLAPDARRRIAVALDGLTVIPREGDIKKLQGSDDEYRLRVGDWRVMYRPDDERHVVVIFAVSHRRDAYRD